MLLTAFRTAAAILCLLVATPTLLSAQSEAQSSEEIFEFQRTKNATKTVRVYKGDRIHFPAEKDGKTTVQKGDVIAWSDTTLTILDSKTNEPHSVNLDETPYVTHIDTGLKRAGWILTAGGITLVVLNVIASSLVLLGQWSLLTRILFVLIGTVANPTIFILLGVGIFLLFWSRRKMKRSRWGWRRLKEIFSRKPHI